MPITKERVWNDIVAKLLQGLLILLPSLFRLVHLQNKSPNSRTDRRIHHVPCAVVPRGDSCQGGKGSVFVGVSVTVTFLLAVGLYTTNISTSD